MLSLACPRCSTTMRRARIGFREIGAYRDAPPPERLDESGWQCPRCEVAVVPGELAERVVSRVSLGGGPSERDRRRTTMACPACFGTLDHLLLSWGESYVEIEQCPRCRTLLLDPGELPRVISIERDAKSE